ncbi:hypothetical protein C8Q78DRAFT_995401 [Trametes maxima]|nr:hypothetical protein C8Q78DRAFT_995401 [Trametes maxima]
MSLRIRNRPARRRPHLDLDHDAPGPRERFTRPPEDVILAKVTTILSVVPLFDSSSEYRGLDGSIELPSRRSSLSLGARMAWPSPVDPLLLDSMLTTKRLQSCRRSPPLLLLYPPTPFSHTSRPRLLSSPSSSVFSRLPLEHDLEARFASRDRAWPSTRLHLHLRPVLPYPVSAHTPPPPHAYVHESPVLISLSPTAGDAETHRKGNEKDRSDSVAHRDDDGGGGGGVCQPHTPRPRNDSRQLQSTVPYASPSESGPLPPTLFVIPRAHSSQSTRNPASGGTPGSDAYTSHAIDVIDDDVAVVVVRASIDFTHTHTPHVAPCWSTGGLEGHSDADDVSDVVWALKH